MQIRLIENNFDVFLSEFNLHLYEETTVISSKSMNDLTVVCLNNAFEFCTRNQKLREYFLRSLSKVLYFSDF